MRIRWKLMTLLLVAELVTVFVVAGIHRSSTRRIGQRLFLFREKPTRGIPQKLASHSSMNPWKRWLHKAVQTSPQARLVLA